MQISGGTGKSLIEDKTFIGPRPDADVVLARCFFARQSEITCLNPVRYPASPSSRPTTFPSAACRRLSDPNDSTPANAGPPSSTTGTSRTPVSSILDSPFQKRQNKKERGRRSASQGFPSTCFPRALRSQTRKLEVIRQALRRKNVDRQRTKKEGQRARTSISSRQLTTQVKTAHHITPK